MIELNRNYHLAPNAGDPVRIKIVGLGGAGCNALDRIVLDGIDNADLIAINTDLRSLTGSVAAEKVQLGHGVTRGLGAGGDPELGLAAAEEALEDIRHTFDGAEMIFVCVGLGGGTGSGAASIVASVAREQGAFVVVFATMPFTFEGKRRTRQAEEALAGLQEAADVVVCFENDKMGDAVAPTAGVHQAFANADHTISQSVRAISDLLFRNGLIHIGFADLLAALRNNNSRCLFGFGQAEGDNRAHDALARALKNPLMDRGRMLSEAHNVLVNVAGGPGMTLNEVQLLMEELGRYICDDARILFGTAVDAKLGGKMNVTIISSIGIGQSLNIEPAVRAVNRMEAYDPNATPEASESPADEETIVVAEQPEPPRPVRAARPKMPGLNVQTGGAPAVATAASKAEAKQETLQFEPVTRGRFEKSEPTIVDGQDLDVPTFLRRNVRVK